jgi:Ca2+-binding EF-hand superfamily protein
MAEGINQQEEKELKRVFDHLANHVPRTKIQEKLKPKLVRKTKIEDHKKSPDEVRIADVEGNQMTEEQIDSEYDSLRSEIETLQAKIHALNSPSDGVKKIQKRDLAAALKAMGKACTREEIDYMVWEVDDNLDDAVDWDEFRLMFHRNITDDTGLEPFQLFNIVQFMTYDKTFSGSVTVDDTMSMLYARFGRDQLEPQMRKLFGDNASSADGGGSLTITDYLKAVSKREIKPKGIVECLRR